MCHGAASGEASGGDAHGRRAVHLPLVAGVRVVQGRLARRTASNVAWGKRRCLGKMRKQEGFSRVERPFFCWSNSFLKYLENRRSCKENLELKCPVEEAPQLSSTYGRANPILYIIVEAVVEEDAGRLTHLGVKLY